MTTESEAAIASDAEHAETEHAEKPVRERLRKTTISQTMSSNTDKTAEPTTQEAEATEEIEELDEIVSKPESSSGDSSSPGRKRSFEEADEDDRARGQVAGSSRHHSRKRSRDSTAEEDELNNGQRKISGEIARDHSDVTVQQNGGSPHAGPDRRPSTPEAKVDPGADKRGETAVEAMTSPKFKKSRLHPDSVEQQESIAAEPSREVTGQEPASIDPAQASPVLAVAPTDEKQTPVAKLPPASGFANTSTASPFASLPNTQSPSTGGTQVFTSAFEASGFKPLAGSSLSGFGSIGKSSGGFGSGGSFGSGTKESSSQPPIANADTGKSTSSGSAFGGALGRTSAFGNVASTSGGFASAGNSAFGGQLGQKSGFGNGGGFASSGFGALGGGEGLTNFSSGKPSLALGSTAKPAKAFGAPPTAEDEEGEEGADDDGDDSGFRSPLSQEPDRQDERFYPQEAETGEEDELTEYSCRAKLYNFSNKEWKERGLGFVRLKVKKADSSQDESDSGVVKPRARLLMRADGSHRVILNTPVNKGIRFGAPDGSEPKGGFVYFMGTVDGQSNLEMLQLKVRQQFAQELHERIADLQAAM